MELSALDTRILRHCLEHGVLDSEREIARKLRISPSTLSFKMRRFEDRGIITAYRYRVDYSRIGLHRIAWLFFRMRFCGKGVKDVMERLLEHPQVHVCLLTTGENNVCVKAYSGNRGAMEAFISALKEEFRDELEFGYACHVTRQVKGHNQRISGGNGVHVDGTDLRVLSEKMQNPKASINWIAARLGLHRNTVRSRWEGLLGRGVVVKKTPIINPDFHREMGIYLMSVNLFTAAKGGAGKLAETLAGLKEVHELDMLEGSRHSLLVVLRTRDMDEYYRLVSKLYTGRVSREITGMKSRVILTSDSRRHTYLKDIGFEKLAGK